MLMITGLDTVLVVPGDAEDVLRDFLDDLWDAWPSLVVSISTTDGDNAFAPWADVRTGSPQSWTDALVARDEEMRRRWDEDGYSLDDRGEGPIALYRAPAPWRELTVLALEDPYARDDGMGYEPYPVTFTGSVFSLITLVTPDAESPFSVSVLSRLKTALVRAS